MQHLDQRPIPLRRLARNQHDIPRIDRVMKNAVKRSGTERADHLHRDAQHRSGRQRSVRLHPIFRRSALEVFGYVNHLVAVESEIMHDGDVDVIEPPGHFRLNFELLSKGLTQVGSGKDFQGDIFSQSVSSLVDKSIRGTPEFKRAAAGIRSDLITSEVGLGLHKRGETLTSASMLNRKSEVW